jgi:hypothetical protein
MLTHHLIIIPPASDPVFCRCRQIRCRSNQGDKNDPSGAVDDKLVNYGAGKRHVRIDFCATVKVDMSKSKSGYVKK